MDSSDLSNWKKYPLPINTDSLVSYNHSNNNWVVYESRNFVHAKKQTRNSYSKDLPFKATPSDLNEEVFFSNAKAIIKVNDGYLISFYRGEFGGYLYWFSFDGLQKKKVSRALIVQFIKRDSKIYAIDGLDHMSLNIGSIREIWKNDQGWSNTEYLKLPASPYGIIMDKSENFIIVTSENIISVDKNKNLSTLYADGFWRDLYPTSIVMNKGDIYVGMRAGVFVYNPKTGEQKWLIRE